MFTMIIKTKNIAFAIAFFFFISGYMKGQFTQPAPTSHAQWKLSSKKINDCEYDLVFTVTLEKGWHTFSINKVKDADLEVFPTAISFKTDNDFTLVGNLTETKPTPEFDKTINKTVYLHYGNAVFTQRVKLKISGNIKISGRYEYQVCNEVCEKPPYKKFDFDLKGSATCIK